VLRTITLPLLAPAIATAAVLVFVLSIGAFALPAAGLHAARVSGARLPTALVTVVVPLLRPALLAAWGVCFLTAVHEVTMSSLLYGPGSETLAVVVLNSADLGGVGVTAALSVLVTAVVLLPAAALWALARPGGHRRPPRST
jgi:iron(III) transport system permease protein